MNWHPILGENNNIIITYIWFQMSLCINYLTHCTSCHIIIFWYCFVYLGLWASATELQSFHHGRSFCSCCHRKYLWFDLKVSFLHVCLSIVINILTILLHLKSILLVNIDQHQPDVAGLCSSKYDLAPVGTNFPSTCRVHVRVREESHLGRGGHCELWPRDREGTFISFFSYGNLLRTCTGTRC